MSLIYVSYYVMFQNCHLSVWITLHLGFSICINEPVKLLLLLGKRTVD